MLLHGNSMMAIMTILFRVTTQRCSGQAMAARLFDKFVCGLFVGRVTVLKEYPIGIYCHADGKTDVKSHLFSKHHPLKHFEIERPAFSHHPIEKRRLLHNAKRTQFSHMPPFRNCSCNDVNGLVEVCGSFIVPRENNRF